MTNNTNDEYNRMVRAMASAEYRALTSKHEQLRSLLFTFSIKRAVVASEFALSKDQIYRFVKSEGSIRQKRGRPPLLNDDEQNRVKQDLRTRAEAMRPATRNELIDMVCSYYINYCYFTYLCYE